MLIAKFYDLLRGALVDPGDVTKQRERGGVQIDSDPIDAGFHSASQGIVQFALVDIVLILAHADGFRVDLDELR